MLTVTPEERTVAKAAELLHALASPTRLAIFTILTRREVPVGALATAVGLSQSALSQHLAKLRRDDLVTTRRDAQTIYYSCNSTAVKGLLDVLASLDDVANDDIEPVLLKTPLR